MPRRLLVPLILAIAGLALALWLVPLEQAAVREKLATFPDADIASHQLRPVILGGLCLIPAVGGLLYAAGGTMARYVTRQFLALLGICFFGLAVLWLLIDLQDNLEELKLSKDALGTASRLYAARLPELVVTLLPYALLLSLLFCLGRLSNSREIVAMIQTGRGLARLTTPFFLTGLLSAALCAGLNYSWAPRATAAEKAILDTARGLSETAADSVVFRNPRARRLWRVGTFPADFALGAPLLNVRVIEDAPDGSLRSILVADTATWSRRDNSWTFTGAYRGQLEDELAPVYKPDLPDPYLVTGWRETPAEIIQPGLPAAQLGIPELNTWLRSNPPGSRAPRATYLTQWHHRWAQPVNCLIVVLLATPLGIVFSRRGASGGVAVTVFLCAGLLFFTNISLTLGDARYLPPALAAWLPNLVFGGLALYLFHRRLAGQPIYQTIRRMIPNEA